MDWNQNALIPSLSPVLPLPCRPTIAARALPLLFPSLLHLSSQCRRYFTFDTETKAPSAPCRFHPGHFRPYGGVTGG